MQIFATTARERDGNSAKITRRRLRCKNKKQTQQQGQSDAENNLQSCKWNINYKLETRQNDLDMAQNALKERYK